MDTNQFYARLPATGPFQALFNAAGFARLPDDWHVAVTDVEGSTRAIQAGRYRQVNTLGVASIMAVLNAVRPLQVPYAFGGDGALLCVPDQTLTQTRQALLGARRLAQSEFDLSLRVGTVPVDAVRRAGGDIWVGKHQVSPHYTQAAFHGSGCALAEGLVKDPNQSQYRLQAKDDTAQADFSGFECRWRDIPSLHGEMVSLIGRAQGRDTEQIDAVYVALLAQIQRIYGDPSQYCPVTSANLTLTTDPHHLANELGVRTGLQDAAYKRRYRRSLPWKIRLGKLLMGLKIKNKAGDWGRYKETLVANSDFRKFGDGLHMVISGTAAQRRTLVDYLEGQYQRGTLVYGVHIAPTALMTCIVSNYDTDHIHFIDGAEGGYTLAAADMKQRLDLA